MEEPPAGALHDRPSTSLSLRPRQLLIMGLILLTLGLAWRVERWAFNAPLWGDEAYIANNLLVRDYHTILLPPLEHNQVAPPLFLILELFISRTLGFSELALRLPALLAGVVGLLLFAWFVRKNLAPRSAVLTLGFLAASYYAARHATEVKPYSIDLAISLGLTMLAWNIHRGVPTTAEGGCAARQISWVALILLGGVAVWLSLPSIFVLGGIGLFLLVSILRRRRWPLLTPLVLFGVIVAGTFLWQYVLYLRPLQQVTGDYHVYWAKAFPPLSQWWRVPLWILDTHAGNMMAYPIGGARYRSTATLLLVILGVVSLWRNKQKDLLLLLLAPLAMALAAAFAGKYPYGMSARTMLFMAPAFCLLAGEGLAWALSRLLKARADAGVVVAACVLAGITLGGMALEATALHVGKADLLTRSTFADLARASRPGDQWIFINSCPTNVEKLASPDQLKAMTLPGHLIWSESFGNPLHGDGGEVFRFYAARSVNVDNRWGPAPEAVPVISGRTFLISFHSADDQRTPAGARDMPPAKEKSYVDAVAERLGEPVRRQIMLPHRSGKGPSGMMFIYEFAPAAGRI